MSEENKDHLLKLINLEKNGANLDQMRDGVLALEPIVSSLKEQYQAILSDLIRFFVTKQ